MNEIVVLMSTYNGEKYLEDQLKSIISQKDVNLTLVIRDDGSKDSTDAIIEKWRKLYPDNILRLHDDYGNLGVANSFMYLLTYAINEYPSQHFFSFADQDDVWLPEKLKRALSLIPFTDKPALYYSKKTIVNVDLKEMGEDEFLYQDSFLRFLTISNASGCTFVFNRALAIKCLPKPNDPFIYHDAWIFRMAGSIESELKFDERSFILYRQHEGNVVGSVRGWDLKKSLKRVFGKRNHVLQKTFQAIYSSRMEDLNSDVVAVISNICKYTSSFKSRMWLLRWKQPQKYGFRTYLKWCLKVIFNGI